MLERHLLSITTAVLSMSILFLAESLKQQGNSISENTESPNFSLGGYFGVHRDGVISKCGKIDQESGVYLVEAMRYAVRKINANNETLFGLKLGYRIFDTCSDTATLRNDIANMILHGRTIGVVGPATSDEAILASSAFGIFKIPLVSYSASSIDLADRDKYFNFFRTIPADDIQDKVIIDILKYFNWTYISTVNSHGNHGQRGMDNLISMLKPEGICIATRNVLPKSPNKSHFEEVVRNLNADAKAKTVVLFTTADDTYNLLKAAKSSRRFTWLSSSAWSADMETVRGVEHVAKGAILINYANINSIEYKQHFLRMKLLENNYKWFAEFWMDAFNCSLQSLNNSRRICTGNESLTNSNFYGKYASAGAVIDAVDIFACALRRTILWYCRQSGTNRTSCARNTGILTNYRVQLAMQFYISRGSTCPGVIDAKQIDAKGAYYRDIAVINFDGKNYHTVGTWKRNLTGDGGFLNLTNAKITWYNRKKVSPPVSVCSFPCKSGEITIKSETKVCCFICKSCGAHSIVQNNTCVECGRYEVPNQHKTVCKQLPVLHISINNGAAIATVFGSSLGIIINTIILVMFIKHINSRIVKASSRELSFMIIFGLYLCFISPFIFFLRPTKITCGLRRFIFGISLTACYTPLMLKTNRIYRIFKAANVMVSVPQLVSPQSQIIICSGLLGVQLLLCIMWLLGDPPTVHYSIVKQSTEVAALCKSDIYTVIINLIPCFCMMSISTIYAFKTRKFPKNYNEAFSIGITMYISCFLWAIFIPLLLWVKIENSSPFAQEYVIATFSNLIGMVSLIGLFGPKIRRLLRLRKESISTVMFSSAHRGHSVNNSIDIGIERSIDASIDHSIGMSTTDTLEDDRNDDGVNVRRKTF